MQVALLPYASSAYRRVSNEKAKASSAGPSPFESLRFKRTRASAPTEEPRVKTESSKAPLPLQRFVHWLLQSLEEDLKKPEAEGSASVSGEGAESSSSGVPTASATRRVRVELFRACDLALLQLPCCLSFLLPHLTEEFLSRGKDPSEVRLCEESRLGLVG